jgi:Domain of unknown function (DUF4258)
MHMQLTANAAQQEVRKLAATSSNIVWTNHIFEQMDERGIDADDVLTVLRSGYVDNDPERGKQANDWKVQVSLRLKDRRVAVVVTVIQDSKRLILVTAFWRDGA